MKSLSRVRLFVIPWTIAHQAPPSMGFSRQEYWSGLPLPSPGDLPDPGIKPRSPALQADALTSEPKLVTTFLPESKCLNSMAVVNIYSDLGAQIIKSATVSPSICHEVMGPDAMILVW